MNVIPMAAPIFGGRVGLQGALVRLGGVGVGCGGQVVQLPGERVHRIGSFRGRSQQLAVSWPL